MYLMRANRESLHLSAEVWNAEGKHTDCLHRGCALALVSQSVLLVLPCWKTPPRLCTLSAHSSMYRPLHFAAHRDDQAHSAVRGHCDGSQFIEASSGAVQLHTSALLTVPVA